MTINSLYIQKSFCLMGRSLGYCLGCRYCRLLDRSTDGMEFTTLPSSVNTIFRSLPVAVNLLYGDPTLQVRSTVNILSALERDRHTGPVVVILKGAYIAFPRATFDLDLHFAFSTFGVDHYLDGGSRRQFCRNLEEASRRQGPKYSIEFRPIVYSVNDSQEAITWVMWQAYVNKMAVGYSGLQGKPGVVAAWEATGLPLQPYPGYRFGHKKMIGEAVEQRIRSAAGYYGVPLFRKTSCLVSYVHGLARDYNAHYYRPDEVGCGACPMGPKCLAFKAAMQPNQPTELPYAHEVLSKQNHECVLKRNGTCEFPTDDCSRISGNVVKTSVPLTTADVRVTKWLTGMTVDADFTESPYLSDFWMGGGSDT